MNSRAKGARGERLWRDELRAQGFTARRGQQFSGSPDSPDVVCEELKEPFFPVLLELFLIIGIYLDKLVQQGENVKAFNNAAAKRVFAQGLLYLRLRGFKWQTELFSYELHINRLHALDHDVEVAQRVRNSG